MTHASMSAKPPYDPRNLVPTNFTTKERPGAATEENQQQRRRSSAKGPAPRLWQSEQDTPVQGSVEPPCLDARGRWYQQAVPHMTVVPSPAQELTIRGADAPPGSLGSTGLGSTHKTKDLIGQKVIGTVHSYGDVSPLAATECVHETEGWADRTSEAWHGTTLGTTADAERAGLTQSMGSWGTVGQRSIKPSTTQSFGGTCSTNSNSPREARTASVDNFWAKSGAGMPVRTGDLARSDPEHAGTRAGPYNNNVRLVGSKWRYVERPLAGAPLFTDYYGPVCGGETSNYYGRSYVYAPQ